ncbi:MAG TPA: O-antigen ligase family protein [Devosia sp.]|nr:O-antigen ligase family protein [Devosia sp.]
MLDDSPGMPLPFLLAGTGIWIALVWYLLPRLRGPAGLLFMVLSARYMVTFYHEYTTNPILGGQSLNSFVTLGVAVVCLFYSRHDLIRYRAILPVYGMIAALLVSGLLNMEFAGTINALIRQGLFLGLMILVATAIDAEPNDGSVSRIMLAAFVVPLCYQLMSVVFRLGKASESDGSVSYMGGYVHESVFSIMLLTALVVIALSGGLTWKRRTVYMALIFTALFFANYRTSVIAAAPILLMHIIFGSANNARAGLANYVRAGAFLFAIIFGAFMTVLLSQRMADLGTLLTSGGGLIKPPSAFGTEDRSLLSGRILIWSDYLYTTLRSDVSNLVFGFGPDSWQQVFSIYAHNVYISYVYEIGFVGTALYLYMLAHFLWLALAARPDKRWHLVGIHLCYGILCLGTMPTFSIEGVLFYAVICGYTLYYYLAERVKSKHVMPGNSLMPTRLARARSLRRPSRGLPDGTPKPTQRKRSTVR